MIYIGISEAKWKEFEEYHREYIEKTVPVKWQNFLENKKIKEEEKLLLKEVLKKQGLTIPDPDEEEEVKRKKLEKLVEFCICDSISTKAQITRDNLFQGIWDKDTDGKPVKVSKEKQKKCANHIVAVLGYNTFSESEKVTMKNGQPWNRHSFMAELGIKVCPYCNRQYITSYYIKKEGKKVVRSTTDTDHYYPKSYFPLLSMNLYNMIPSCQICNSRMKIDKVQKVDEAHLYPYKDKSDSLQFEIEFEELEQLYNFSPKNVHITLKAFGGEKKKKKGEQSKKIFKLEDVYEAHQEEIFYLKERMKQYSREQYEKIFSKNYTGLCEGYEEWIKLLYPFLNEDEKSTPLTKMKTDIYHFIKDRTST